MSSGKTSVGRRVAAVREPLAVAMAALVVDGATMSKDDQADAIAALF